MDLYVDGANGIGADKIKILSRLISSVSFNDKPSNGTTQPILNMHLFNDGKHPSDKLNHLVSLLIYFIYKFGTIKKTSLDLFDNFSLSFRLIKYLFLFFHF